MIVERYIANEFNRSQVTTYIAQQPLPFSVTVTENGSFCCAM